MREVAERTNYFSTSTHSASIDRKSGGEERAKNMFTEREREREMSKKIDTLNVNYEHFKSEEREKVAFHYGV